MPGSRYRADPSENRRTARIDGLTLVYHRPSGATHILASPAPEILEALAHGPADAETIVARLASRHDFPDAGDARMIVAARLAELADAGLAERL